MLKNYIKIKKFSNKIEYMNLIDPNYKFDIQNKNIFHNKLKIDLEGYCDDKNINDYINKVKGNRKEIIFLGKSNVGKSSLINKLVDKDILSISKLPGKTQKLYFMKIITKENNLILVDSPGSGFNMAPNKVSIKWPFLMQKYLDFSPFLLRSFVLLDSRRTYDKSNLELIKYFEKKGIFYNIIFTKSDKINNEEKLDLIEKSKKLYSKVQFMTPIVHFTSSKNNEGINYLKYLISNIINDPVIKKK